MNTLNPNFAALVVLRVFVLLVGLAFAWLGYRLFLRGFTKSAGDLEVSPGKAGSFKLANVAPGVFFALFGAAIIAYSVTQPLELIIPGIGGVVGKPPPAGGASTADTSKHVTPPTPPVDTSTTGGGAIVVCDTCKTPPAAPPGGAVVVCDTCKALPANTHKNGACMACARVKNVTPAPPKKP